MNIKDVKKNNAVRNFFPYLILLIIICATFLFLNLGRQKVNKLTSGELISDVKEEKVTDITLMPKSSESVYYVSGKLDGYKTNETFEVKVVEDEISNITNYVNDKNIK